MYLKSGLFPENCHTFSIGSLVRQFLANIVDIPKPGLSYTPSGRKGRALGPPPFWSRFLLPARRHTGFQKKWDLRPRPRQSFEAGFCGGAPRDDSPLEEAPKMPALPTKAPTVESTMPKHEEPKALKPVTQPSSPPPRNPSSAGPAPYQGKKDPATGGIIYGTHAKTGQLIRGSSLLREAIGLDPICIWCGD